eukprot:2567218-Amphidinium_carterae.1
MAMNCIRAQGDRAYNNAHFESKILTDFKWNTTQKLVKKDLQRFEDAKTSQRVHDKRITCGLNMHQHHTKPCMDAAINGQPA